MPNKKGTSQSGNDNKENVEKTIAGAQAVAVATEALLAASASGGDSLSTPTALDLKDVSKKEEKQVNNVVVADSSGGGGSVTTAENLNADLSE